MPRPSKLTPETQKKIVDAIKMGATYELAAQYGGIHYDTFNNWMKRGVAEIEHRDKPRTKEHEEETPYIEFFEAIKQAEGDAAVLWLAKIEKSATEGNWQAAAWKLERRYPDTYGRRDIKHSGNLNMKDMSDDELQRIATGGG